MGWMLVVACLCLCVRARVCVRARGCWCCFGSGVCVYVCVYVCVRARVRVCVGMCEPMQVLILWRPFLIKSIMCIMLFNEENTAAF